MVDVLSIRSIPMLIAAAVFISTALLCLTITLTTSQSILESTRDVDRTSLDTTHDVARRNVETLAGKLMTSMQAGAAEAVLTMLAHAEEVGARYRDVALAAYTMTSASLENSPLFWKYLRPMVIADLMNSEATHLGLGLLKSKVQIHAVQAPWSLLSNIPSEKVYMFLDADGKTYREHLEDPLLSAALDPETRAKMQENNLDSYYYKLCPVSVNPLEHAYACNDSYSVDARISLQGMLTYSETFKDFPWYLNNYDLFEFTKQFVFENVGHGVNMWSSLVENDLLIGCTFSSTMVVDNEIIGSVGLGFDLRTLSRVLATLPRSVGQRIFVAVADYELWAASGRSTIGNLVAASHGASWGYELAHGNVTGSMTFVPKTINVSESEDGIVRAAGLYMMEEHNGNYYNLDQNVTYPFTVSDPDAARPHGSKYLLRSKIIRRPAGIIWAVVVLVPYDEILGEIESNNKFVLKAIETNDDDLRSESRTIQLILYLLLCLMMVMVIAMSSAATIQFTRPLLQLRDEMAHVA
eukprot:PhM_4_TR11544/c1_g1_i1/m.88852